MYVLCTYFVHSTKEKLVFVLRAVIRMICNMIMNTNNSLLPLPKSNTYQILPLHKKALRLRPAAITQIAQKLLPSPYSLWKTFSSIEQKMSFLKKKARDLENVGYFCKENTPISSNTMHLRIVFMKVILLFILLWELGFEFNGTIQWKRSVYGHEFYRTCINHSESDSRVPLGCSVQLEKTRPISSCSYFY